MRVLDFKHLRVDQSHFIFKINVGKMRIRHTTTVKLNDEFLETRSTLDRLKIQIQSRYMSDPTISDIDFRKWHRSELPLNYQYCIG